MSDYVATARVRVRPDMTGFRAQLAESVVRSSSGIGVKIPVIVDTRGSGTARKVQEETRRQNDQIQEETKRQNDQAAKDAKERADAEIRASKARAAADAKALSVQQEATRRRRAGDESLRRSAEALNLSRRESVIQIESESSLQRLQTRLTTAETSARDALAVATQRGNVAEQQRLNTLLKSLTIQRQIDFRATAAGIETLAAQQSAAARSASNLAAQQSSLARGAGASLLTLLGLRGATLAANSAFLAGTAGAVALGKSISSFASFEQELNVFQATAEATGEEMKRVSALARELGRDATLPGVSASDAARGLTALSKAGLDVEDSMDGVRGVLLLSTAAQISQAEAAELAASALNAFNLEGAEATRVADLLAASANQSQGSITDVGIALQQASAAARQTGFSVDDTVAVLTLLARAGIRGSDAGTSLRTALLRLVRPSNLAQKELDRLQIRVRDIQGRIRPEVFAELANALDNVTKRQKEATLELIFGKDAFRAAAILGRARIDGLNEMREAVSRQGEAERLASARTKGFSGDVAALENTMGSLGLTLGKVTVPILSEFFKTVNAGLTPVASLVDALGNLEVAGLDVGEVFGRGFGTNLGLLFSPGLTAARGFQFALDQVRGSSDEASAAIAKSGVTIGDFRQHPLGAMAAVLGLNQALRETPGAAGSAGLSLQQLAGRFAGLEEQQTLAQISGDRGAEQEALRAQETNIRRRLRNTSLAAESRRRLQQQLLEVINQQRSIDQQIASEQEQAAQDAKRAADDAHRDQVDAFNRRVSVQQNRIIEAESSETLRDDVRAAQRLVRILKDIISSKKLRGDELLAFQRQLLEAEQQVAQIFDEIARNREEAARERAERRTESLELDVELAQTREDVPGEIRARQRLIRQLQKAQADTKRGSIEFKRLRNSIAEQRAAIRELKKEQQGKVGDMSSLAFEFLREQRGFAANLLGNLIPLGAQVGTVGNVSPGGAAAGVAGDRVFTGFEDPTRGLRAESQIAAGRGQGGPSRGQQETMITISRAMLRVLRTIERGQGFPESNQQKKTASASMDFQGGV